MWNYLVVFSSWAENNSGQIQILIAVFALWLAYAGYKKVLKQISMAKEQEEENYQQRNYELKIQIINLLFQTSTSLHTKLKSLHELQDAMERAIPEQKTENEIDEAKKVLDLIKGKITETEYLYENIIKSLKTFSQLDDIDYKKLNASLGTFYTALISSIEEQNAFDVIKIKYFVED
ncbi:hypothetical protein Q5M79_06345 [Acinetobacter baumannii]|nr:hypothetical protein [Acinetobacter baumannii]